MPNSATPHAAQHSAQRANSFLSRKMRQTHREPLRIKIICKLETISDRKQKGQLRFGNQPENPARGYNSAKGMYHRYILLVKKYSLKTRKHFISNLKFQISKVKFMHFNSRVPRSTFHFPIAQQPYIIRPAFAQLPGGSLCAAHS
jgi:hypothetical protein